MDQKIINPSRRNPQPFGGKFSGGHPEIQPATQKPRVWKGQEAKIAVLIKQRSLPRNENDLLVLKNWG